MALSCAFNPVGLVNEMNNISVVEFLESTRVGEASMKMTFIVKEVLKGEAFGTNDVVFEYSDNSWRPSLPVGETYILGGNPDPVWGLCDGVQRGTRCNIYKVREQIDEDTGLDIRCEAFDGLLKFLQWAI